MKNNNYKLLKLKELKNNSLYSNENRTYYKSGDNKIYMSQKENPRVTDKNYLREGNLVFYNANNKIGEPEFPLNKKKVKIQIIYKENENINDRIKLNYPDELVAPKLKRGIYL